MNSVLLAMALAGASAASTKAARTATVTVKANDFEAFNKEHKAIWKGNVIAVRGAATLRCDRMEADTTEKEQVTRAVCDGHVEAKQGDNWVAGKHAEFDNEKGIITVTGDPHAKQGANEVSGEKIVFYVDEDRMQVEKSTVRSPGEKALERDRRK